MFVWTFNDAVDAVVLGILLVALLICGILILIGSVMNKASKWNDKRKLLGEQRKWFRKHKKDLRPDDLSAAKAYFDVAKKDPDTVANTVKGHFCCRCNGLKDGFKYKKLCPDNVYKSAVLTRKCRCPILNPGASYIDWMLASKEDNNKN